MASLQDLLKALNGSNRIINDSIEWLTSTHTLQNPPCCARCELVVELQLRVFGNSKLVSEVKKNGIKEVARG